MYKTDSFVHNGASTKKSAARATMLQKPLKWLPPSSHTMKLWVLNADVHLNEDGEPVLPDESPYLWLGDVCSGQPDILQAEMQTGQHFITDPNTKSIATLPLDKSALSTLIAILKNYYI